MFSAFKDERLKQLRVKAGSLAYMTHLFVSGFLIFAALITSDELLNSAAFLLMGPTYVSATVAVIVLVRGGYFRTIRDEANRTEIQRRIARWDVIVTSLASFTTMFVLRQIFLSATG
ncbi:MAG: hypothetical protein IH628_13725, partial [Proteobacteria bacterium]|nr:hypothetical protein [Pseudomonadota bacterium]